MNEIHRLMSQKAFHEQIQLFMERLAPNLDQKQYLEKSRQSIIAQLAKEAADKEHPLERTYLVALCGEMKTKQQQAEFTTRLLLLDILIGEI